jgi:hypothetical protein
MDWCASRHLWLLVKLQTVFDVELIRSEYSCGISLAQVAAAAGVHPVTVAVAFRRHFGKSVGDYIADLYGSCPAGAREHAPPNC